MEAEFCDVALIHEDEVHQAQAGLVSGQTAFMLAETFAALSDPNRLRLISALFSTELCVCDLAALVGLSESAVSHQLRLLRGMRVVRPRRAGRMVFYALDDEHVVALFEQGLRHIEEAAGRGPVAPRAADDGGRASHGRRGAATRLAR